MHFNCSEGTGNQSEFTCKNRPIETQWLKELSFHGLMSFGEHVRELQLVGKTMSCEALCLPF